jgi:hypothetical protein
MKRHLTPSAADDRCSAQNGLDLRRSRTATVTARGPARYPNSRTATMRPKRASRRIVERGYRSQLWRGRVFPDVASYLSDQCIHIVDVSVQDLPDQAAVNELRCKHR